MIIARCACTCPVLAASFAVIYSGLIRRMVTLQAVSSPRRPLDRDTRSCPCVRTDRSTQSADRIKCHLRWRVADGPGAARLLAVETIVALRASSRYFAGADSGLPLSTMYVPMNVALADPVLRPL